MAGNKIDFWVSGKFIGFMYDAMGNRVVKYSSSENTNNPAPEDQYMNITYYQREAGGKEMEIFKLKAPTQYNKTSHLLDPNPFIENRIVNWKLPDINNPSGYWTPNSYEVGYSTLDKPQSAYVPYLNSEEDYEWPVYGSESHGRFGRLLPTPIILSSGYLGAKSNLVYDRYLGHKDYELKDHLGNARLVFSDMRLMNVTVPFDYYLDVRDISDYYPFGSLQSDRTEPVGQDVHVSFNDYYRYGYTGMERDDDIKGTGISYTTRFRQYGARLGRWLSVDPLAMKFPSSSPYVGMGNNPVLFIDPDGKDAKRTINHGNNTITITQSWYVQYTARASYVQAIDFWKAQNNVWQWQVGSTKDGEPILYDIIWTFNEPGNIEGKTAEESFKADKSGFANYYSIPFEPPYDRDGNEVNGLTVGDENGKGANFVEINAKNKDDSETGPHEMGHTMFLGHFNKGIMTEEANGDVEVTRSTIYLMLYRMGVGKVAYDHDSDKEISEPNAKANIVTEEIGERPDGFEDGRLIKK